MNENEECPICSTSLKPYQVKRSGKRDSFDYNCRICGNFNITGPGAFGLRTEKYEYRDKKYILSGIIRKYNLENEFKSLNINNYNDLIKNANVPKNPLEAIDLIISFVSKRMKKANSYVFISHDADYPIAFAKDKSEFCYYLDLAQKLKYLEAKKEEDGRTSNYRLDLKGWERVDELRKKEVISDKAFVAMWFDKSMDEPWEHGFKKGLEEVGYDDPLRVDKIDYNDKIDDKIIAEIRKSGLVVADFTGNRAGVYFEAGFAMGLGIPVIWTCKKSHLKKLHFDTRQYNHISWETTEELKEKLIARIEATITNLPRNKEKTK